MFTEEADMLFCLFISTVLTGYIEFSYPTFSDPYLRTTQQRTERDTIDSVVEKENMKTEVIADTMLNEAVGTKEKQKAAYEAAIEAEASRNIADTAAVIANQKALESYSLSQLS